MEELLEEVAAVSLDDALEDLRNDKDIDWIELRWSRDDAEPWTAHVGGTDQATGVTWFSDEHGHSGTNPVDVLWAAADTPAEP